MSSRSYYSSSAMASFTFAKLKADLHLSNSKVLIYLLLGLCFALLNLRFIDLGTSRATLDVNETLHHSMKMSTGDKVLFFVFDVVSWPFALLRNLFVYQIYLFCLVLEVVIGAWLVKTDFWVIDRLFGR